MPLEPTKQELHSEEMKKRILDAAEKLFNEYGVDRVRIRDIAAQAGMTTGAIYHHYKNKDELLLKIFERSSGEAERNMLNNFNYSDPLKDIERFLCDVMVDQVFADGLEFTKYRVFKVLKYERNSGFDSCCDKLVKRASQQGLLNPSISLDEAADYIKLIFRGTIYEYCMRDGKMDLKTRMKERVAVAMQGVANRNIP